MTDDHSLPPSSKRQTIIVASTPRDGMEDNIDNILNSQLRITLYNPITIPDMSLVTQNIIASNYSNTSIDIKETRCIELEGILHRATGKGAKRYVRSSAIYIYIYILTYTFASVLRIQYFNIY